LQLQKSRSLNIDIETYYEIIRKKTATLIAACTSSGARASGASQEIVIKAYEMGINIGMAFQIKDDLFDYQDNGSIGKPAGNDIKEKKFTLPLIYALNQAGRLRRNGMIRKINRGKKNQALVNEVVQFVKENGGVEYAIEKMEEFKQKALQILDSFPDSPANKSLKDLVEYTVSRKK